MYIYIYIYVWVLTAAVRETLEADVRSKFQTKRRQEDAKKGILVEVPFDNTIVKFFWKDERVLLVTEIVRTTDETLVEFLQREENQQSNSLEEMTMSEREQKAEDGRIDGEVSCMPSNDNKDAVGGGDS